MATPNERRAAPRSAANGEPRRRGFVPGREVQDWIEAEAEVRERMRAGAP